VHGGEGGMCSVASLPPPPPPFGEVAEPIPLPKSGKGSHPIEYFYCWPARRSLDVVWRRGWDSNPRSAVKRTADFESAPLQPLRYLSIFLISPKILALIFSPLTAMPLRDRGWPTSLSASLAKGFYYNPACHPKL
jgi:hypothetical protein